MSAQGVAFRASSLSVLVKCPGSWELSQMFPDPDEGSDAAAEGTAAHEVGADILNAFTDIDAPTVCEQDRVGKAASNGVIITKEMFDSAREYANSVIRISNQRGLVQKRHVEQFMMIPDIDPLCGGTPDCWAFDDKTGELFVWDFKHGHQPVEVFENYQLIAYAIGALRVLDDAGTIKYNGQTDQAIRVHMTIVQPRAHHREGTERTWSCMASDLRGYVNVLQAALQGIMEGNANTRAGSHCLFCSARGNCETLTRAAGTVLEFAQRATGIPLEAKAAAVELDLLERGIELLKARRTGLESLVEQQIKQGVQVPYFTLVPSYGRKSWALPAEEVLAVSDAMGVDIRKPVDLLTPKQAAAAGLPDELVEAYTTTPQTGMKLTRDLGTSARRVFDKNVETL